DAAVTAASRATDAAMAVARPGRPAAGVIDACAAAVGEAGFRLTAPRVGHGQGLDYSERPFLVAGSSDTFEAGNVVVIHPQIDDPETGAMRVPVGDCCLVTEHGADALTKFPRAPFLAE